MNRSKLAAPHWRIALVLMVVSGLALGAGCEELSEAPDDTIRGAGSIDLPIDHLTSQPAENPAGVSCPESVESACAPGDSRVESPQGRPTHAATAGRTDPDQR
jgi:hypothetical protein